MEITLERQCFGCEGPYTATLRSDGSATRVFHGNTRMGIAPRTLKGSVGRADFDRLATLLVTAGFFDLADSYRDPQIQDGQWVTTSAVRAGDRKSVLDSNRAGPPALDQIEKAIEAVIDSIVWTPATQD
jgi:hypothetical protein